MSNKVFSVTFDGTKFGLEIGDNEECPALEDLEKNWNKLDDFEVKKNHNVKSLSGFCRNYLQPALSLMNDGNIARGVSKREKTPEELKAQAEKLEKAIEVRFYGTSVEGKNKTSRRIGVYEKITDFSKIETPINDEIKKAELRLSFLKINKLMDLVKRDIEKYSKLDYSSDEALEEFKDVYSELQNTLNTAYAKIA